VTDPNELIEQHSLDSFRIEKYVLEAGFRAEGACCHPERSEGSMESAHGTKMGGSFASFRHDNAVTLECCR